MSQFSSAWLRLREPVDAMSRAEGIARTLNRVRPERPIAVTDLASGTGANLRYLSQALGGVQQWRLIDHDQALLDSVPDRVREWAAVCGAMVAESGRELIISGPDFECRISCAQRDLARDLDGIDLPAEGLVTASALLDLVSHAWLETLAQRCLRVRAPVLFALSYDGRVEFHPREPGDERVQELVNRHQETDKGFGPALGPAAASRARQSFEAIGYRVECERSDWHIQPSDQNLQAALLDGWLTAAVEMAPGETSTLQSWRERRRVHVAENCSELNVGHLDLFGWLPA